jgi:glycosyltransferase involved in cell wall biosynthesis
MKESNKKEIVFLTNHISYFASHRLVIAEKLMRFGYNTRVISGKKITDETRSLNLVKSKGVKVTSVKHLAGSTKLISIIWLFLCVTMYCWGKKNIILHCVSTKSAIVGLAVGFITRTPVVLSLSGFGLFLHSETKTFRGNLKSMLVTYYFLFLSKFTTNRYIIQNNRDKAALIRNFQIKEENITLTLGSGVILQDYKFEQTSKQNIVLMASRLLNSKGVYEYISACKKLKKLYPNWNFVLAGDPDLDSPDCVNKQDLQLALTNTGIEWVGHQINISSILETAKIFVLPSYYNEGFPKVLIEASASGCAIITTDLAGCRDAVNSGETGILIAPKDTNKLISAIQFFIDNQIEQSIFAKSAYEYAQNNFSITTVFEKYIEVYESLAFSNHRL